MNESDNIADIDKLMMRTIGNWSEAKIKNNETIKDILNYENTSLWWFFDFDLYNKTRKYVVTKKNQKRNVKSFFPAFFGRSYILIKVIFRFLFGKMSELLYDGKSNSTKILFMSYALNWKDAANPLLKDKKADLMIGDVLREIKDHNFTPIALDYDTSFFIDFKTMFEKMLFTKGVWKPIETYLTLDIIKTTYNACKIYDDEWRELKNNPNFIKTIQYNSSALFNLLEHDFDILFKYRVFTAILYIELVKRAIKATNPKAIVITCEYCMFGKASVIAGKIKGVPTIAIQHGNISPLHKGYMYAKNEIRNNSDISTSFCLIPDKTAVFGQHYYDLLTRYSAYPENSVIVTGSPRYDILAKSAEIFNRDVFCRRHNLNPMRKIVLICTENLPIFEDNIIFLESVLESIKNTPDIQFIIKPHPGEKDNWYKKIVKEQNIKATVLTKNSNTYEAIYACDLMIANFSTTITEALILEKSVISVNLTGRVDAMPYTKNGVVTGVYDKDDIASTIQTVLQNEHIEENMKKTIDDFIFEHCNKIDGNATKRVVSIIKNMIQE